MAGDDSLHVLTLRGGQDLLAVRLFPKSLVVFQEVDAFGKQDGIPTLIEAEPAARRRRRRPEARPAVATRLRPQTTTWEYTDQYLKRLESITLFCVGHGSIGRDRCNTSRFFAVPAFVEQVKHPDERKANSISETRSHSTILLLAFQHAPFPHAQEQPCTLAKKSRLKRVFATAATRADVPYHQCLHRSQIVSLTPFFPSFDPMQDISHPNQQKK